MNDVDAVNEIIAVLSGSEPFSGAHPDYGSVLFSPSFPQVDIAIPAVAFTPIGGTNQARGLGTAIRIGRPAYQVDVLADTEIKARRIFQRVMQAIVSDYESADGSGNIGKGYLGAKGIKSAMFDEPRSETWDEAGRVRRVVSTLSIRYLEEV